MMPDDFTAPSRVPVPEPTSTRICSSCEGFGWAAFDRRLFTTRNPAAVAPIIRCAGGDPATRTPVPTAAAAKAILEGRIR